jgi:hypothetical protein
MRANGSSDRTSQDGPLRPLSQGPDHGKAAFQTLACGHGVIRDNSRIARKSHWLRLNPFDSQNFAWYLLEALSFYFSGEAGKGLEAAKKALAARPRWSAALKVASLCLEALGRAPSDIPSEGSYVPEAEIWTMR